MVGYQFRGLRLEFFFIGSFFLGRGHRLHGLLTLEQIDEILPLKQGKLFLDEGYFFVAHLDHPLLVNKG